MGVQQSKVSNRTGEVLYVLVFSDVHTDHFLNIRQPPTDGRPIELDGSDDGAPVKVGVVHNEVAGRFVFDLFRLSNGATLVIRAVTKENGVREYERVKGVELVSLGRTIHKAADSPDWPLKFHHMPQCSHSGELSPLSQSPKPTEFRRTED